MKQKKQHLPKEVPDTMEHSQTWNAGYDSVISGPDLNNCHFTYFTTVESLEDWQRGVNAAKEVAQAFATIAGVAEQLASHPDNVKAYAQISKDVANLRTCRQCGCNEFDACYHPKLGNCWWIEDDLCSHCKKVPGKAIRYSQMSHI